MAGMLVGVLALTGCAAGIDVSTTEAKIGAVAGVNDATVRITHPGAPWNTETIVRLYVSDDSASAVAQAVRGMTAAVVGEPIARHGMVVVAHPGRAADQAGKDPVDISAGDLPVMRDVAADLGVTPRSDDTLLRLTPDDIRRIAGRP